MSVAGLQVLDAQVHVHEQDHPGRPWDPAFGRDGPMARIRERFERQTMPGVELIREMDAVGVHGALIVTPSLYGFDNGYSLDAARLAPDRLAVVGRLDPQAPDVVERVREWRSEPLMLSIRIGIANERDAAASDAGLFTVLLEAAGRHEVPVCLGAMGFLGEITRLVTRFRDTQFVIDHLALPHNPPDRDPFERLAALLDLARCDNVSVKMTGIPMLSREPFPFRDLWHGLHRVLDAFGRDRVMWGSDFTRCFGHHPYREAVAYVRDSNELSLSDLEWVMGGTLRRVFRWSPSYGCGPS